MAWVYLTYPCATACFHQRGSHLVCISSGLLRQDPHALSKTHCDLALPAASHQGCLNIYALRRFAQPGYQAQIFACTKDGKGVGKKGCTHEQIARSALSCLLLFPLS